MKRLLDISLSSLMLAVSAPVSLIIALAIKLEDGGPVFYRQERWGWKGRKFKALKFRTMVSNSDRLYGIRPAEENDPRITRVGRVLRKMGLDELPHDLLYIRRQSLWLDMRLIILSFWISFRGKWETRSKKL